MKRVILMFLAAFVLSAPLPVSAQGRYRRPYPEDTHPPQQRDDRRPTDAFERSVSRLRPGADLVVARNDGNWIKGRLVAVQSDLLTIERDRVLIDIQRQDIDRVWHLTGNKTAKGSEVGSIIGAIAGAAALGSFCHDEGTDRGACLYAAIPAGGVFGAGSGWVIGAAVGSGLREKRLVYVNREADYATRQPSGNEDDGFTSAVPRLLWEPPGLPYALPEFRLSSRPITISHPQTPVLHRDCILHSRFLRSESPLRFHSSPGESSVTPRGPDSQWNPFDPAVAGIQGWEANHAWRGPRDELTKVQSASPLGGCNE